MTRSVLIIDPFTVPKRFEEAGLTSEVMANRIGDTLRQIEQSAQTQMRKDDLSSTAIEGSPPDIEIPGTKLGLKTVVDISRNVFGIYPKHISGGIFFPVATPIDAKNSSEKSKPKVTFYVAQGRNRSLGIPVTLDGDDVDLIVQRTAETILEEVNPYVLAAYRYDHHDYVDADKLIQQVIQNSSSDRLHKGAAYNLWGLMLKDHNKYEEAIAKYQKSIEFDAKSAPPYANWGVALSSEGKYKEGIAKYQISIEFDPKSAFPYLGWCATLEAEKKYEEAIAKCQKSIELDPKVAVAYTEWGFALEGEKKYEQAIKKYQNSIEVDPKFVYAYLGWGNALEREGKHEEAIAKYQKVIEVDPKSVYAYLGWGNALEREGKHEEAIAKFTEAKRLSQP